MGDAAIVLVGTLSVATGLAVAAALHYRKLVLAERRRGAGELREQARVAADVFDSLPIGIAMRDLEGRYVFVNRAWEGFTGARRADVIGKTVRERAPKEEADAVLAEDAALLARPDEPGRMQELFFRDRHFLLSRTVLRDSRGEPNGVLVASVDTSERYAMEEALRSQGAELAERVKFIDEMVDALPISVAMRDLEGRYLLVNRTWERYFDIRREDAIGRRRRDLPGPTGDAVRAEDADRIEAQDRELIARGPDYLPEPRELVRLGRSFLITSRAIADSRGRSTGVLSAGIETTERRAMEERLALEQRRAEAVVLAARVGIVDWDGRTHETFYSPRFKEILGYPPDAETAGWPDYFDRVHPDDQARVKQRFREHIVEERQSPYHEPIQYRLRKADGSYVWVEALGASLRDAKGFATRFIAAIEDVSVRRAQEEALETEQKRLDLVVRAARVGIVDWDGHTHATYYSPRFKEILGYAPDADTSDWPDYFKVLIHPDDRARVTKRWRSFIFGTGPEGPRGQFYAPEEYRLLRKDGSYVWVQVSGMAVRDEKNFVVRWIAATTDITERRAQEETLRASVRLREEVERMSRHDLKTPLNSVVAMSRLLRESGKLAPEDMELLGTIERAGYRILNMVNLSLDLFRMEQGTWQFHPQAVNLAQVASRVAADLDGQAASKSVLIQIRGRSSVLARADELLCYSMLANLVKNAIEAAPEGSTVSLSFEQKENEIETRVHNAGAVAEEMRGRFFEKYATAGKSAGLGLGTYSARLMARVQEGDISMQTGEEGGTTLTVRLKAATAAETAPTPPGEAAAALAVAHARESLPPLKVLVVDDDEFNRLVLRRTLPHPPLRLSMAVNGRAALEAAERDWPDVVLLDLEMPVMDGYQAARLLREKQISEGREKTTIIAISSNDEQAIIDKALAAGCDHYLTKPAPREVLWRLLKSIHATGMEREGSAEAILVDPDLEDVLPAFIESRRALLDKLLAELDAGDRAGVQRVAHKLAGSLALYNFGWASAQCRALERDAASAAPAELRERAAAVRRHLGEVPVRFAGAAAAKDGEP
ncbi:MAG: PAS domain S-box protein [Clostridia bacterium]